MSGGSCRDLRKFQDNPDIHDAFSKLVSGKAGYKTIIERRKDIPLCPSCRKILEGEEKFCPECGTKIEKP
ncbi:MAG: zinc-ribbon domain-containing protein [archaeon]